MLLLATVRLFAQSNDLPKNWDKDFTVSISHNSSMSSTYVHVTFTYDSCTYSSSVHGRKPKKKKFALTQADRDKILAKLDELKVDKISSSKKYVAQRDGWSTTLSFGGHYVEGGSGVEISEKDRERFQDAYQFLEKFAAK